MKKSPVFVLAALGIGALSLITIPGRAAPDKKPAPHLVQVKVEWITTAPGTSQFTAGGWAKPVKPSMPETVTPTPIKSLALVASEDQTGTVSFQPGAQAKERESMTARAHVNADQTITVHLSVSRTDVSDNRQTVSTIRTFKPGERVVLSGLRSNTKDEIVYATASLVKPLEPIPARLRLTTQALARRRLHKGKGTGNLQSVLLLCPSL